MAKPIQDITIVGGGSSGWLAAAFFSAVYQSAVASGRLKITLIESPSIGIIGVGEALAPSMPSTLKTIGVQESDLIRRCHATFKLGGYFLDWNKDAAGKPTTWCNPFGSYDHVGVNNSGYYYLRFGGAAPGEPEPLPFDRATSATADLIMQRKAPRQMGTAPGSGPFRYAYHMDAGQFALVLRDASVARGVRHVLDDVEEVKLDERGFVSSLRLKENGEHPIELVIDATGFRGVILRQALGEPFEPYDRWLLNDSAAVMQIPHKNPGALEPATRATALSGGWSFRVPLSNRNGTGYIFSSQYLKDEEASAEFKAFLGAEAGEGEPRVIRWRIGKTARSWVKNCVGIGLSSGFVEPLEATAIYSVEQSLKWLALYLPDSDFAPSLATRFNRLVNELYDEVVDYVALHFHLSNRTDSDYWRAFGGDIPMTDRLKGYLEMWRDALPEPMDLETSHFFGAGNYLAALMGKNFYDGVTFARSELLSEKVWRDYLGNYRASVRRTLDALPDQRALIDGVRAGSAVAASSFAS